MSLQHLRKFVPITQSDMARILVSGGGSIGARHARNIQAIALGEVTISEPDAARRAVLQKEFGVVIEPDYEAALAAQQPDIVFVCSPTGLHVPQARAALRAGAHVFIEKPLSHSMEGIAELVQEATQAKRMVMVGCNMRFHPGPATVKRLVDDGAIGDPIAARIVTGSYLPAWRPHQDYHKSYSASPEQGGAVLDCIHEIDLALWYFGPASVQSAAVLPAHSIGLETDGLAEILLQHASGVLSSVHLNFIQREQRRSCHIIGTEGSLLWDICTGAVEHFGADGLVVEVHAQPQSWDMNQMYIQELEHFRDAINNGIVPFSSLKEAVQALRIALDVRQST